MRNLTFEEEIDAISQAFNVSPQKIKEIINPKKKKNYKQKPQKPKEEVLIQKKEDLNHVSFDLFEDEYILSKNQEEELKIIEKYIPSCRKVEEIKYLHNLCPISEKTLKDKIVLTWVSLANNLEEIREVKRLVNKGTIADDLAYKKFIKFFK